MLQDDPYFLKKTKLSLWFIKIKKEKNPHISLQLFLKNSLYL